MSETLQRVRYESDERVGQTSAVHCHFMNVRPVVLDFQPAGSPRNTESNRDITIPITVHSTDDPSGIPIRPRGVIIREVLIPGPGELVGHGLFIPVFRAFAFSRYHIGTPVDFQGSSYILVSRVPEFIRS